MFSKIGIPSQPGEATFNSRRSPNDGDAEEQRGNKHYIWNIWNNLGCAVNYETARQHPKGDFAGFLHRCRSCRIRVRPLSDLHRGQVVTKINEWGLDGILIGIHEYPGENIDPSRTLTSNPPRIRLLTSVCEKSRVALLRTRRLFFGNTKRAHGRKQGISAIIITILL